MSEQVLKKQWGHNLLSPTDCDLPGLKFGYLVSFFQGKKGKVLEIGCASGKNLRSLHEYNTDIELFGIDIDCDAITEGKKCYDFICFECGSGENLPYKDQEFDYIVISDYLEHVLDFDKAMQELQRVLKKGGHIHAFVPCEGQPFGIYWIFKKLFGFNVKESGGHTQFFSRNFLKNAFVDRGFEIIDTKYSYHLLGQIMDFAFYSLLFNKKIAKLWWEKNKYYHSEKESKKGIVTSVFNTILTLTNWVAYMESKILKNVPICSTGIHLTLKKN